MKGFISKGALSTAGVKQNHIFANNSKNVALPFNLLS